MLYRIPCISLFLLLTACGLVLPASAQETPSADGLIERSLAYHDPEGVWYARHHRLLIDEARAEGVVRKTEIQFDFPGEHFFLKSERDGHTIEADLGPETCAAMVDGSSTFSDELRDRFRLGCEALPSTRDYYGYTLGLPMKLQDAGTVVDPKVEEGDFMGRTVWVLRVTYDETIGSDVWYFYFDPASYALVGSRFYHDESRNDGEYLQYDGEIEADGVRLPRVRSWYMNADDEFLGTDTITAYEQLDADPAAN